MSDDAHDEPIYDFVKGKGWLINHVETLDIKHAGRRYRLELRKPRKGEKYLACVIGDTHYETEGKLDLFKVYTQYVKYYGCVYQGKANGTINYGNGFHWITVVYLGR